MRFITSSKISDANFRATHVSAELLFASLGIYLLTAWEAVMNADGGRRPGVWHEHCAISPCKRAKLVTNWAWHYSCNFLVAKRQEL